MCKLHHLQDRISVWIHFYSNCRNIMLGWLLGSSKHSSICVNCTMWTLIFFNLSTTSKINSIISVVRRRETNCRSIFKIPSLYFKYQFRFTRAQISRFIVTYLTVAAIATCANCTCCKISFLFEYNLKSV